MLILDNLHKGRFRYFGILDESIFMIIMQTVKAPFLVLRYRDPSGHHSTPEVGFFYKCYPSRHG